MNRRPFGFLGHCGAPGLASGSAALVYRAANDCMSPTEARRVARGPRRRRRSRVAGFASRSACARVAPRSEIGWGRDGRQTHEPKLVRPDDIDPHHRWDRPLAGARAYPGRFRGADQLPPAARLPARAHAARRSRNRGSARCCASTSTTSATPRAPSSASGRATSSPATRSSPATATRISGTSAPRRSTIACTRRGCTRTTAARGCSACAARPVRDIALFRDGGQGDQGDPRRGGRRRHAARDRRRRAADAVRAAEARDRGARRPAGAAPGARSQEHRRADAAQHGRSDGRRRLHRHRRGAEARGQGVADRRARDQAPLRDGLGLRRGDQLDIRRALQPASAQLHRPADPPGRPGVLRHHPVVHGLPHLLLPHVQRRARDRRRSAPPTARRASGWTRRSSCSSRA